MGILSRAFCALPLAAALFATPAAASTILTFDDGDVNGGGYLFTNIGAQVVDLPGHGKALYIPTVTAGPDPDFAALGAGSPTVVEIGGEQFLRKSNLLALEILPLTDTLLEVKFGLSTFTDPISAQDWYSVDFYGNPPMTEGWRVRADGGFYIDNIEVEWIYEGLSSPVPEPAAWALMIAGFGLAGATLRRRRYAAAS